MKIWWRSRVSPSLSPRWRQARPNTQRGRHSDGPSPSVASACRLLDSLPPLPKSQPGNQPEQGVQAVPVQSGGAPPAARPRRAHVLPQHVAAVCCCCCLAWRAIDVERWSNTPDFTPPPVPNRRASSTSPDDAAMENHTATRGQFAREAVDSLVSDVVAEAELRKQVPVRVCRFFFFFSVCSDVCVCLRLTTTRWRHRRRPR